MLLFKNQLHVKDIVYYDFFCYLKSLLNCFGWLQDHKHGHSLCKTYTYTHGRAYGSLRNEVEQNEMKWNETK